MLSKTAPCGLPTQRNACARMRVIPRYQVSTSPQAASSQERVTGASYTEVVQQLAERALRAADASTSSSLSRSGRQHIVGIAGAPGSGKTTLAQLVAERINDLVQQRGSGRPAVVVPMDGFHYYRWQLDQMPHPEEAYARRGAHWTFDAEAFVKCVRSIRATGSAAVPSFDHGIGDPVMGDIRVTPAQGIVLVEGNYLYLDEEPWLQLRGLLDDTWYVDVPLEVAMQRVYARQVALGLDPAVSKMRVSSNDQPNARMVQATKGVAKVLVPSDIPF